MSSRDYYKILNVRRDATAEQIQGAYRAMAFRFHPDRNRTAGEAMMALVNEAYETLGEPRKRSAYDRLTSQQVDAIGRIVLRAAREQLLKSPWPLITERADELLFRKGADRILAVLTPSVDAVVLRRYAERTEEFVVLLAPRVEHPLPAPPPHAVVIDLMRSQLYGLFPDLNHRRVFEPFLGQRHP